MFKIGATDARRLMTGDSVNLWREKKGLQEPEDLSGVLRVQMGIETEELNRAWFSRQTKTLLMDPEAIPPNVLPDCTIGIDHDFHGHLLATSNARPWAYCHPDGFIGDTTPSALLECKHTAALGDYVRPTDIVVTNYWQLVHQMMVTGLDRVFLSVFYGHDEWRVHEVLRDEDDVTLLLGAELMFLRELEDGTPPGIVIDSKPTRIPGVPIRRLTQKDVEEANWGSDYAATAQTVLGLSAAVQELDTAKDILRELLPEDAERIEAFGVRVLRTRRGVTVSAIKSRAA